MKLGKKLIVTLMATKLATVGTFSGFCLAANSGEGAGQKVIEGVPEHNNDEEKNENDSNVKAYTIDEKQLKEELPKIIEEIKKFEKSESKSNGSGSSNDDKCIIVNDEQLKKEISKSRVMN